MSTSKVNSAGESTCPAWEGDVPGIGHCKVTANESGAIAVWWQDGDTWRLQNRLGSTDGTGKVLDTALVALLTERGAALAGSPTQKTLLDLGAEVRRARAKFPGNRFLLAALQEEVGELAQAYLQRQEAERVRHEAIQVACVAVRIIEEGDATFADITEAESEGAS